MFNVKHPPPQQESKHVPLSINFPFSLWFGFWPSKIIRGRTSLLLQWECFRPWVQCIQRSLPFSSYISGLLPSCYGVLGNLLISFFALYVVSLKKTSHWFLFHLPSTWWWFTDLYFLHLSFRFLQPTAHQIFPFALLNKHVQNQTLHLAPKPIHSPIPQHSEWHLRPHRWPRQKPGIQSRNLLPLLPLTHESPSILCIIINWLKTVFQENSSPASLSPMWKIELCWWNSFLLMRNKPSKWLCTPFHNLSNKFSVPHCDSFPLLVIYIHRRKDKEA